MPHNGPLKLSVATAGDLLRPAAVLLLMVFLSALFSPQPVAVLIGLAALLLAGWGAFILEIFKVNTLKLISIIFTDGQVRLESADEDTIGGYLDGQQWCTGWFAILQVNTHGMTRTLLILSAQQSEDDYRRLVTWLRYDRCNGFGDSPVPGM